MTQLKCYNVTTQQTFWISEDWKKGFPKGLFDKFVNGENVLDDGGDEIQYLGTETVPDYYDDCEYMEWSYAELMDEPPIEELYDTDRSWAEAGWHDTCDQEEDDPCEWW